MKPYNETEPLAASKENSGRHKKMSPEETQFYILVGHNIRDERELLDWKQTDLSEHSDITRFKIHRFEGGLDRIRCYELVQICKTLNLSADYMLGLTKQRKLLEYPPEVLATMNDLAKIQDKRILESFYQVVNTVKDSMRHERQVVKKIASL